MRFARALALAAILVSAAACRDDPTPLDRAVGSESSSSVSPSGPSPSLEASDAGLRAALTRYHDSPPSYTGRYEYPSADPENELIYDLWVDPPAFRLVLSIPAGGTPIVIATRDGKLFGYRQNGEVGTTHDFGEGVWILGPLLLNDPARPDFCFGSHKLLGVATVVERQAFVLSCKDPFSPAKYWVDAETGLILRKTGTNDGQPTWSGFTSLDFESSLDPGLFDPASV